MEQASEGDHPQEATPRFLTLIAVDEQYPPSRMLIQTMGGRAAMHEVVDTSEQTPEEP